jgi:hypothetical protein
MKTILITGGTSGIGSGVAAHYLKKGERVIAIGSSAANGVDFQNEAEQLKAEERAIFIQADLSLVAENKRIMGEIESRFPALDALILCAARYNKEYIETTEGLEVTFALCYLSRFILGYGLKECLEKADNPVIMNVCGSGMKGDVNWNDLQHKNSFGPQVMMHGSRLNDLLGVAFAQSDTVNKIRYILYNPWAVQTPGMLKDSSLLTRLMFKVIGKSIEKATVPITALLDNPPSSTLAAYRERKKLDLGLATYDKQNAQKLHDITLKLLNELN